MKNDSLFFPFEMPGDSVFDTNKDGKLTGFETAMRDAYQWESFRHFAEDEEKNDRPAFNSNVHSSYVDSSDALQPSQEDEDKYEWRDYCEDGSDYDIYPEDYETEEEYMEALQEAKDEAEDDD